MLFREMQEADLEEILALDREIFRSMAYSEQDFLYAISGKFDKAIVLIEREEIIAYGIFRLLGTEAELESIAVREAHRGRISPYWKKGRRRKGIFRSERGESPGKRIV